jgi:hypothetical protein
MAEGQGQRETARERPPAATPAPEQAAPNLNSSNPVLVAQQTLGNRAVQRHLRSGTISPRLILGQQRTLGNQAVQRLLLSHTGQATTGVASDHAAARATTPATASGVAVQRITVQRITDEALDAQATMQDIASQATDLIRRYRGDADGLASDLLRRSGDWEGSQIAFHVFSRLGAEKSAVLLAMARQLDAARLRQEAQNQFTRNVIMALGRELRNVGEVSEAERIIGAMVSPQHAHLLGETPARGAAVQAGLAGHGAQLQSVTAGSGSVVYDEYWIILDTMPPNLTAEAYLTEMTVDLNAAVHNEAFDTINVFRRTQADQQRGAPALGDIYDIDILGPDNGSVILVERTASHFIFQTVATTQTGAHPEFGSREFGFERLEGGAIRFYTRGVSRAASEATGIVGAPIQTQGWTAMLQGIGQTLENRGGRQRPGSFGHWIRRG